MRYYAQRLELIRRIVLAMRRETGHELNSCEKSQFFLASVVFVCSSCVSQWCLNCDVPRMVREYKLKFTNLF